MNSNAEMAAKEMAARFKNASAMRRGRRPRFVRVPGAASCFAAMAAAAVLAAAARAEERKEAVVDAPLPPAEAAATMVVPEGFHVTLFAAEPDVKQPIGFCIDDRGRLWVAEAYNYPVHGTRPGDRILIFSDDDGDGRFDRRTVFYDRLNYVTGIEVGFGGAWVVSPPYFYFIPDRDGDGRPDGEPQVLLDGLGNHANAHNLANALAWGPDGWLYGTHGRTNWSMVGKPGTPDAERVRFDGGVYRYHPVRHVWEAFADGTTNPWSIDWNDVGEGFVCNCVNPHLFHVIQGAHYEPWRNRESSRYAYQRLETIADHLHFVGRANVRDGLGSDAEDAAGGGHAHCGTMIYLADNWPERYRNTLFTNNIHGRRINNDLPRRAGSGYTASHGPDLLRSRDPWFMGVVLAYGPDGAVFVIDWSDTGECHSRENTRRETGRIYKIAYGKPAARAVDLGKLDDAELVELQLNRNDWYVRHARRLLEERAAQGRNLGDVERRLRKIFAENADVPRKLRVMWTLHAIGRADAEFLVTQLGHESEYVRAWAVRLLCENGRPSREALARFGELAAGDESPFVRLYLASSLQRLPGAARWPIAEALLCRAEDAADANLPLMLWYGIEPLVHEDLARFIGLAGTTEIALIARHIGRRVAELPQTDEGLDFVARRLAEVDEPIAAELLAGVLEGLAGRRSVAMPEHWTQTYARLRPSTDERVRERSLELALVFDDPTALAALRHLSADISAEVVARSRAIQSLVAKQAADVAPLLLELVLDPAVRWAAVRGLAEYDHPDTAQVLLESYEAFDAATRQDAVATLTSRPAWAAKLLDAVEKGRIARGDISAYAARQLYNLGDAKLSERLRAVWGELRTTPAEKTRLIATYKNRLPPEVLQLADRSAGRAVFQKTCANCHRFFGVGGNIGPDITGSQRTNLDYLLQTILDPSAAVAKDFQVQVVETSGGRSITGLVVNETPAAVTIQTVNERIVVPADEIEQREVSPLSMMPEGMLQNLTGEQVRNLFAYLMGPDQAPLAEGAGEAPGETGSRP